MSRKAASRVQEINPTSQTTIMAMTGVVVVGVCALFFIASQWLVPNASSLIGEFFSSPTPTRVPTSTPAPTRTPLPNLTATQQAWVKPAQSPSLGSAEEARSAADAGVNTLEAFSFVSPDTPEINQPNDVYVYEIQLSESTPLLWNYSWCTTTQAILEENFSHIRLEFLINGSTVSTGSIVVTEYERSSDGGKCRENTALIVDWPAGTHQLESRITFTQAIDDGWDVYPAGTHIYKYIVTVNQ